MSRYYLRTTNTRNNNNNDSLSNNSTTGWLLLWFHLVVVITTTRLIGVTSVVPIIQYHHYHRFHHNDEQHQRDDGLMLFYDINYRKMHRSCRTNHYNWFTNRSHNTICCFQYHLQHKSTKKCTMNGNDHNNISIIRTSSIDKRRLSYDQSSSRHTSISRSTFSKSFTKMKSHNEQQQYDQQTDDTKRMIEDSVRSMTIRQMKDELQKQYNIISNHIFDKEELIQSLITARIMASKDDTNKNDMSQSSTTNNVMTPNNHNNNRIQIPLYFTSMTNDRIASTNTNIGIIADTTNHPYVTIRVNAVKLDKTIFPLLLLVDTACSGFVLRPEIQFEYTLPILQTPVTMTGATGTASSTGLTQIDSLLINNENANDSNNILSKAVTMMPGPRIPIAIQDINALPSSIDGIIGLTLLQQYYMIEWNFLLGIMELCRTKAAADTAATIADTILNSGSSSTTSEVPSPKRIIGIAPLYMVPRLGIYTIDVYFGKRGPIKMLFDTGASSTLLNWVGVQQLGLSKSSSSINAIPFQGAIGSDNIAIQLTHRLYVSSTIYFGSITDMNNNNNQGLNLNGTRVPIDIGNIGVIDQLNGVGGILGIDIIMKCSSMQIMLKDPKCRQVIFYSSS